jgi:hypothetical protein
MAIFDYYYAVMDGFLMPFFRFPDSSLPGYYLGTFVLSITCVIAGKCSLFLALRFNKNRLSFDNNEMGHYQELSIKALKAGDKNAYRACNSIANDAYGKNFFSHIALAASALWPVFIALGWMQHHFDRVDFRKIVSVPWSEYIFGYFTTFILCYLVALITFNKTKNGLALLTALDRNR